MKINYIATKWGTNLPLEEGLAKFRDAGFGGVEMAVPVNEDECAALRSALERFGLVFIAQVLTRGVSPAEHAASFERQYRRAAELRPLLVNAHTGKDYFAFEENLAIFRKAEELEDELGVAIAHETHRGRAAFAVPATAALLRALPRLRLTADFSHWCCVHESLLEGQSEGVALAVERVAHIHARVGFAEGPQVADFRDPRWSAALEAHLAWWRSIAESRARGGCETLTICPEFGGVPYMPFHPYSDRPVADQWELNCAMKAFLEKNLS